MARINKNYDKLAAGYLFPEIARRTNAFLDQNPSAKVLRLGIGDTTEPIVPAVLDGLHAGVDALGAADSYSGYGPSEGITPLRHGLAGHYRELGLSLDPPNFLLAMEPSQTQLIFRVFFLMIVSWLFRTQLIQSM